MRFLILTTYLGVLIQLQLFATDVEGALPCDIDQNNKCLCIGSKFTLDIQAAFTKDSSVNITVPGEKNSGSMVLSPCVNFECGGKPSRVCQWDSTANNGVGAFTVVGTAEQVLWDVESVDKFTVTFGKGAETYMKQPREGLITFQKGNKSSYSYDGEGDPTKKAPLVYKYTVVAANFEPVAPVHPSGGGSPVGIAGLVIMIVLLLAIVMYFIIGSVVMYTAKGARGVEMIPNYTFWRDLPFLIKDGCVFTFGPCVNKVREKRGYSAL